MALTDATVRNAKPEEKPRKLFDGGGLFLLVTPATGKADGGKWWRLKYRFAGKEKLLSLGTYPTVTLKDAREKRDAARKLLDKGIDPGEDRKAQKAAREAEAANSFEAVTREWHERFKPGWSTMHAERLLVRLENDVFPWIGSRPIADINAPEMLAVLRRIEARTLETAHRVKISCGQIFRYAVATGRAERNPVADLKGALPQIKNNHFAAPTDPKP